MIQFNQGDLAAMFDQCKTVADVRKLAIELDKEGVDKVTSARQCIEDHMGFLSWRSQVIGCAFVRLCEIVEAQG